MSSQIAQIEIYSIAIIAILTLIFFISFPDRSDKEKYGGFFIAFITIGGSIIKGKFVYDIDISMFLVHCALHIAYLYISGGILAMLKLI